MTAGVEEGAQHKFNGWELKLPRAASSNSTRVWTLHGPMHRPECSIMHMVKMLLASAATCTGSGAVSACSAGGGVAGCAVEACWLPAALCTDAGVVLPPGDATCLAPPKDLRRKQPPDAPVGQAQGCASTAICHACSCGASTCMQSHSGQPAARPCAPGVLAATQAGGGVLNEGCRGHNVCMHVTNCSEGIAVRRTSCVLQSRPLCNLPQQVRPYQLTPRHLQLKTLLQSVHTAPPLAAAWRQQAGICSSMQYPSMSTRARWCARLRDTRNIASGQLT